IDGTKIVNPDVTAEFQPKLTTLYTERAVQFIGENRAKPFFLYLAHSMPHVPLFVSDKFKGKSEQGLYGDVIQEIDWSVGEVVAALKKHGLEDNTLVIFTSDNGPWLSYGNHAGTKGNLREGKGSVWDGGVREPCVAKWPGKIPAGSVQTEPLMTIDIFPTLAKLIGAELPKLKIDGQDVWPLFACEKGAKCPHEAFWFYYGTNELQAIRSGKWKLILPHTCRMIEDRKPGADGKPAGYKQVKIDKPMLFDLDNDIGETTDVAATNPDVVAVMHKHADAARAELGDSLTKAKGTGTREPGRVAEK
ncbi:MAG: sulfatase-like hydrolase/transferase, partial [Gemmataceae bacterium]